MNIREIVKDAVNYPLSDWKKILILGIIIVISGISTIVAPLGTSNMDVKLLLFGIGFIIGLFVSGYMFRIIKLSLNGKTELPEFKDLVDMGAEGVKVFLTFIVYSIPAILIILILTLSFSESYVLALGNIGLNPLNLVLNPFLSVIWQGIMIVSSLLYLFFLFIEPDSGIYAFIGILYMIIITPILLVAIANMAYYEGELRSAFRFQEILNEISSIGWFNLIKWYIVNGIIFLIIFMGINTVISYIFGLIHLDIVGGVLISLIVTPYFYMYFARSVALFYMPDKED